MKNNIAQINLEFNHIAVRTFKLLYRKYDNTVENIGQKRDEGSFLQLNNLYFNTLKHQLDNIALSLMDKYKAAVNEVEHFRMIVTEQINFYLKEFNQKLSLI